MFLIWWVCDKTKPISSECRRPDTKTHGCQILRSHLPNCQTLGQNLRTDRIPRHFSNGLLSGNPDREAEGQRPRRQPGRKRNHPDHRPGPAPPFAPRAPPMKPGGIWWCEHCDCESAPSDDTCGDVQQRCERCKRAGVLNWRSASECTKARKPAAVLPARPECPKPKPMPPEEIAAGFKAMRESLNTTEGHA